MFRFAALAVGAAGMSDPLSVRPSCSERGVSYGPLDAEKSPPNGAFVTNALECQRSCAANPLCKKFTWKLPTGSQALGGCWLVYDDDVKTVDDLAAISGPKACDSSTGVEGVVAPITLAPPNISVPGVPKIALPEGGPGSRAVEPAKEEFKGKEEDGKTLVAAGATSPDNALTIGIIGGCAAAAGLAGAAYFFLGDSKKPKKKRRAEVKAPEEQASLVEEAADVVPAAPQVVYTTGHPVYAGQPIAAVPTPYYQPMPITAPVTLQPSYVMQGGHYYQQP